MIPKCLQHKKETIILFVSKHVVYQSFAGLKFVLFPMLCEGNFALSPAQHIPIGYFELAYVTKKKSFS